MTTNNNIFIRVYLTNLGKYNEGYLIGKWVNVDVSTNWDKELENIGVKEDSYYEEYFITDYESNIGISIDEYTSIPYLIEIAEKIQDIDVDSDVFKGILDCCTNFDEAIKVVLNDEYRVFEDVEDETDLGHALVDDDFIFGDIDDNVKIYLDYEAIGRDYMLEVNGTFSNGGFIAIN